MATTCNCGRDRLLLIFVCLAVGCINNSPTHPVDAAALGKLDKLHPKSIIDRRGRVVELMLEGSMVNDEALAAVQDLTELRVLSLYGASISDSGLKHLAGLTHLESLGLGRTGITDDGLQSLKRLTGLRWLWLTELTDVSKPAIDELKTANPNLKVYDK